MSDPKRHVAHAEIDATSGKLRLALTDKLPALIETELNKSIEQLNALLADRQVTLDELDMQPLAFPDIADETRGVPCNANRITKHWWGVTAYLSSDLIHNVGMGTVPATGFAAVLGVSGPIALIVGAAVVVSCIALGAACGKCGVQLDITWAGVPKKIHGRN